MPELNLGIAIDFAGVELAAIDRRGRLVAKATDAKGVDTRARMRAALRQLALEVDTARVECVMLATGHVIGLASMAGASRRIAVIRIGSPLTLAVPPLALWPPDLRLAVSAGEIVVAGGAEYDGRARTQLDRDAIGAFLEQVAGSVEGVAITSVFSAVEPEHELAAAEMVRRELGRAVHVSLSHELGTLGLLERENATAVNAALVGPAGDLAHAVGEVLAAEGIDAEVFLAANDGSLMALGYALRFPVLSIGSAAATGIRGAAHLTGVDEAVVVRAEATATDVGVLRHGTPLESAMPLDVGGIRMSFRMAEVRTLPFAAEQTLSGEHDEALAAAVARVTAAHGTRPLLAIGAARMFVPDGLEGVSEVILSADADVAGAVGVAIAPVCGRADRICRDRPDTRRDAVEGARSAAVARAVAAGADPHTVEVVEVEEAPVTYLVDPLIHVRVKAEGARG